MVHYPYEIDVSLQKLSIRNKKCDNANDDDDDADDDGYLIPMCRPCLAGDTKSVPRITDCHNEVCRVMTNVDREGRFFYPVLTKIMDAFSFSLLNTSLYFGKKHVNPKNARMRHTCDMVTSFDHYNDIMGRRAASVRPAYGCLTFIFPTGW